MLQKEEIYKKLNIHKIKIKFIHFNFKLLFFYIFFTSIFVFGLNYAIFVLEINIMLLLFGSIDILQLSFIWLNQTSLVVSSSQTSISSMPYFICKSISSLKGQPKAFVFLVEYSLLVWSSLLLCQRHVMSTQDIFIQL
jgi:hypothetical protein